MHKRPLAERFWRHVQKGEPDECWPWNGARVNQGYGIMGMDGHHIRAHRVAYLLMIGPIPEGLDICHKCNNPCCVNPTHLYAATPRQNIQDAVRDGLFRAVSGRLHPKAKLLEIDVMQIRHAYAKGAKVPNIAKQYNVCRMTIYSVLHRKTWKHVG